MEEQPWLGRSLNGRYKIEALLGAGGMSAVYKATDPKLRRTVAIKLIHARFSTDMEFIRRFKTEATAIAAFRHPNIVQVYDFDNEDEDYYMVMEYVPGGSLQELLKRLKRENTKMPFEQAVNISISICDALAYAHQQQLIHRDIKPANILLNSEEQPIILDFGLVKILNATSHTASGAIIGTARYMPPEIINNEPPDERSDIYSLGITIYELLTNSLPFIADSVLKLMRMHLNEPVPDLALVRPGIPHRMIRIINRALEKNRDDRYNSAEEMAEELRRVLSTPEPASAPSVEFGYLNLKLPDGVEQEIRVSKPEITVGRGPTNDIVIEDSKISRSHARFEFFSEGRVRVIDTGSTNGVRVNSVTTTNTMIRPGDVVELGDSQIQFVNISGEDNDITIVNKK
jgi:serine/threonine-protein kinase